MASLLEAYFRHARHYTSICRKVQQVYSEGGSNVSRALQLFDKERGNIEMGLNRFCEILDPAESTRNTDSTFKDLLADRAYQLEFMEAAALFVTFVSAALPHIGYLRFPPRQRLRWLKIQRGCAELIGNKQEATRAWKHLGIAYWNLGEQADSIESHKECLALARTTDDIPEIAAALGNLGIAFSEIGDSRKAIEFYKEALDLDRKIGNRRGIANALGNLGIEYTGLGEARKAIEFHMDALSLDRELGDRQAEAMDLGNLGHAYHVLGDFDMAIKSCDMAILIAHEVGDQRGKANDLFTSAQAFEKLGNQEEAVARAEAALAIFRSIEDTSSNKVLAFLEALRT